MLFRSKWDVLGFRGKEDKVRVVLRHGKEAAIAVWATKGLQKILLECVDSFRSDEKDSTGRQLFWLVSFTGVQKLGGFGAANRTFENFQKLGRKNHRVEPHTSGIRARQRKTCILAGSRIKMRGVRSPSCGIGQNLSTENPRTGKQNDEKNNRLAGRGVHMQTFRYYNLSKLFADHSVLAPARRGWGKKLHEETPTHGVFLEREIAAMGGIEALEKRKTPLRCLLGEEKTTPSKRKCRRVAIA